MSPSINRFAPRLLLIIGYLDLGAFLVRAEEMNIGVRTNVTDQWLRPKVGQKSAEGGHGKVFGLLAVEEIKNAERLVKPADEQYLKGVLLKVLAENGFRPYAKGEKPDILLTMSYGRGQLINPYVHGIGAISWGSGDNTLPLETIDIGTYMKVFFDSKTPGYEAKRQKAAFEKLFIRVTAWEFPQKPNAKPKMLWKTIIVADDPANRDLNAIAAEMLAAGAPLFDKEVADKEVDLYKPLPDGHVNVGTPEVVGADVQKTK